MFNILLDALPTEWKGYPIDSDFQTGILINQCLMDSSLSDNEKFFIASDLLFPDTHPHTPEECAEAVIWFMNEYNHDRGAEKKKSNDIPIMDFDVDQWRIYSAFLNQYGIDLNKTKMHWFVFMGLLSNLNECSFLHVMNIRNKKVTSKMTAQEKAEIEAQKRMFSLVPPKEKTQSPADKKAVEDFLKYANLNK